MGGRFWTLIAGIFGVYAFLLFHLYQVQVAKSSYYFAKAESQYAAATSHTALRGTIFFTDKNGDRLPAALQKNFPILYAVPKEIEDVPETANRLALLLGRPAESFIKDLSKKSSSFASLEKNPTPELAKRVAEAEIPGVYSQEVPRRFYPFGSTAAQVLGFVGPNSSDNGESGKYGLEKLHEDTLSGVAAQRSGRSLVAADSGEDISLTIDPTIQTEVEHIIKNLMTVHRGRSASAIVADPKTGKILAMASTPGFDPNKYASSSIKNFGNPLVEEIYEPGSVIKVLTMVAGIDAGKIAPNTTFNDTGSLTLNGRTIKNWDLKAHGLVTMTEVIEGSLNTGAAFAERQTGNEIFRDYMKKFGFGEKTGVDLPGEIAGSINPILKKNAAEINFATASFGQGISTTPIQVVQAISTIANGGTLMRPYLNADKRPEAVRRVMSEDTAKKVTNMMISAVDKGKLAAVDGYSVAGKTGTSQIPDFVNGGYSKDVVASYIGFAPASNPRFIVYLKLDAPYGAPLAGQTVVPAFREVAQFLLNYFQVPPDRINNPS